MNAPMRNCVGLSIAMAMVALPARADFELFWYTIDGGGAQSMTAGRFELDATAGQPDAGDSAADSVDLAGGFWPGTSEGDPCSGSERISKARCRERNGSNQLKVILTGGITGDSFTVTLSDGSTRSGTCDRRGKGKAKFNNRPVGDAGAVTAEWSCGATDEQNFSCP